MLLQQHAWRVLGPATTLDQALRLLAKGETPDVALLDINLRASGGTPVADQLRARGPLFVLASAYHDIGRMVAALAGAPACRQAAPCTPSVPRLAQALSPP